MNSFTLTTQNTCKMLRKANSSLTTIKLNDSDIKLIENSKILTSTINPIKPNKNDNSKDTFNYHSYLNQYNITMPSISENGIKTKDNPLVETAKTIFTQMKSFMNLNKYQLKWDKSSLPRLLMQESSKKPNRFLEIDDCRNASDLNSEITFVKDNFEEDLSFQDDSLQSCQNFVNEQKRSKLKRSETLSSAELKDYLDEVKTLTSAQDENDDFLSCFK